jgi:hypothetical protein
MEYHLKTFSTWLQEDDEGAARPGMGVKQTSFSTCSLPKQTSFKNLTEDEQMEMPRLLVKQSSFKTLPKGLSDASQTIGSRPKHPSRPQRHCVSRDSPNRPKLTVCKNDSNDNEATDTLSSMPLLVKQTSFTVAGHSSRGPLIGDDEKEGNGIDRRRQMAKQDSFTMLRRRSSTCVDKKNDTSFTVSGHSSQRALIVDDENVSNGSNRRLQMAKQNSLRMTSRRSLTHTPFTIAGHSSQALIDDDENVSNGSNRRLQMAKQNSLRMPRRRSLTHGKMDEKSDTLRMPRRQSLTYGNMDEKNDTLSSNSRLVKETSLKGARLSSRGPLFGNDENVSNGSNRRLQMSKQNSLTSPGGPTRTFDSEDNSFETTISLSSTRRLVEQAHHLYNGKAQVSDSEVRLGCSIARTNRPQQGRTGRD